MKSLFFSACLAGCMMILAACGGSENKTQEGAEAPDEQEATASGDNSAQIEVSAALTEAAAKYDALSQFHCGLAAVYKDGKWGYINAQGQEVIPCVYDNYPADPYDPTYHPWEEYVRSYQYVRLRGARDFSEGRAAVYKDFAWGVIDKEGNVVVPFEHFDIWDCSDGVIVADGVAYDINGQKMFDNPQGGRIVSAFHEGIAAYYVGSYIGGINKSGEVVIPTKYNYMTDFSDGKAFVRDGGAFYCIDKKGNKLFECGGDGTPFADGLSGMHLLASGDDVYGMAMYDDGFSPYGFVNEKGETVLGEQYYVYGMSSGGYEGYRIKPFAYGINYSESEYGPAYFFNTKGEKVFTDFVPDVNANIANNMAAVIKNGKVGFINTKGEQLVDYKFQSSGLVNRDGINEYSEGLAVVRVGSLWGYVDKKGNCTLSDAAISAQPNMIIEEDSLTNGAWQLIVSEYDAASEQDVTAYITMTFNYDKTGVQEIEMYDSVGRFPYADAKYDFTWSTRSGELKITPVSGNTADNGIAFKEIGGTILDLDAYTMELGDGVTLEHKPWNTKYTKYLLTEPEPIIEPIDYDSIPDQIQNTIINIVEDDKIVNEILDY